MINALLGMSFILQPIKQRLSNTGSRCMKKPVDIPLLFIAVLNLHKVVNRSVEHNHAYFCR